MKYIFLFTTFIFFNLILFSQATIQEARNMELGSTVTITGVAINGGEMGLIRYIQDETAGIAVYSSLMGSVNRGDNVTLTGTLKDYNNLLEIDPVTAFTVNSVNNDLPTPVILAPSELAEEFEGELVEIKDVIFANGGSTFAGNTSYSFETNGESASIYVKAGSPLEGNIIPSSEVKLIGICSQYSYDDPNGGYQLLIRDMGDIQNNSSIFFTSAVELSNLSTSGFELSWTTNTTGDSWLMYGNTGDLELGTSIAETEDVFHQVSLTNFEPSEIIYAKAVSTDGNDTIYSPTQVFITQSESAGEIIAYFNTETEDTASSGTFATTLDHLIDDTVIQYINRAEFTIDLAIYNINNNGISNISEALNEAFSRGVVVRIVHDGSTACVGLNDLDEQIPTIASPTAAEYGIMHNKFLIIDANAEDANQPILWTGSTNFTVDNINKDANNVVIIQDKSLALAYKLEFEEMWGSSTDVPNLENAKFGFDKSDNTPHNFIIGGNDVELYFSPSDQTNTFLIDAIESADHDLSVETMLITRSDIAYAIRDINSNGVATNVITDNESSNSAFVNDLLRDELKAHFTFANVSNGILHHKFMVVDQGDETSDPLVFTGSHNWSNGANNINDENTLVIHSQRIANEFYQQFVYYFIENEGSFVEITEPPVAATDTVDVPMNGSVSIDAMANDIYTSDVTFEIFENATNGNSSIPFTNPYIINYTPNNNFEGTDTVRYKIAYKVDPDLFAIGTIILKVKEGAGINQALNKMFTVFPNPNKGDFTINFNETINNEASIKLIDLSGRIIYRQNIPMGTNSHQINSGELSKGYYIVNIDINGNSVSKEIIIN
ncbi:MAG: T9SS type A sorting domain-containing protein [Salinivirgaceae bacterium]|nr:T9SS type A sorting domain-containing protein [Salinivirgaceae bacterium]